MIDMNYRKCCDLFRKYELLLTEQQWEKLTEYAEMLIHERERQNVTAVRETEEIWIRHFLDSAYLVKYLPQKARLIDVGTGGGIPGIPLAILNPELSVTLLDSESSKISFCQSVVKRLALSAEAIHARAEELSSDSLYRAQFDAAVSRAMAAGSMLTELSVPFLRVGGHLFAMKGRGFDPETERFGSAAKALGCKEPIIIRYEIEGEPKNLIDIEKNADTPPQYPRRFAKIKRSPL